MLADELKLARTQFYLSWMVWRWNWKFDYQGKLWWTSGCLVFRVTDKLQTAGSANYSNNLAGHFKTTLSANVTKTEYG